MATAVIGECSDDKDPTDCILDVQNNKHATHWCFTPGSQVFSHLCLLLIVVAAAALLLLLGSDFRPGIGHVD